MRPRNSAAPAGRCAPASAATPDSTEQLAKPELGRRDRRRARAYAVAPQWTLVGYVDVGGGDSDFTWRALASANYAISPTMTAKFGYRYMKVDYHRDNFLHDVATGGPYAGIGVRF